MAKTLPADMGLGQIVREIINNQQVIHNLVGRGIGDPKYFANTPLRHQIEQKQQELYAELDRREQQYRGS